MNISLSRAGSVLLLLLLMAASTPSATAALRVDTETTVAAPRSAVWSAWTTNEGARSFFAPHTNIELALGGAFEILFDDTAPPGEQGSEGCTVLSYQPMEMLSFSWSAPPKFAHARPHRTWVVVRFEALADDHTRVQLSHIGFDEMIAAHPSHRREWEQVHAYFSRAWPSVLASLERSFRDQEQAPPPDTDESTRVLETKATFAAPVDEVWAAFTESDRIAAWMVPSAHMDLRIDGELRTNYTPDAADDDPGSIRQRILSYEPERLLSMRVEQCPEGFPHAKIAESVWNVVHFEPVNDTETVVRICGVGWREGPGWDEAAMFFDRGNTWTLEQLHGYLDEGRRPDSEAAPAGGVDVLARLLGGEWRTEGEWSNGQKLRSRTTYEWGIGRKFIRARTYASDGDGEEYLRYETLYGWNEEAGTLFYTSYAFDGTVGSGTIEAHGPDSFTFHAEVIRQTVTFLDDDRFGWIVFLRTGPDTWEKLIESTWERTRADAPKTMAE